MFVPDPDSEPIGWVGYLRTALLLRVVRLFFDTLQVHVSAIHRFKAFVTGRKDKGKERCSKSTGKTRTFRHAPYTFHSTHLRSSPHPVFRDQLYKHLETVPENDFDTFATKFIQAGSTLEFLKYADPLFEIILVGGLIQPGGSYVEDGAPTSPFTIFNANDPATVQDLKKYVEVLNKLIRRYACPAYPIAPTPHTSQIQISSETS